MRSCRRSCSWALVTLFCGGLAPLATAQTAPDGPPRYRAVLDNGLVLLFRPNPGSLTLATCCFIKTSARVETRETAGLRQLAQMAALDITDASGRTLEERVAAQGMVMTQQLTADYMETLIQGMSDQLEVALGFTRELFAEPSVSVQRLRLRQASALREVAARRELAETVAFDRAVEHLYHGTPCAWPPVGTPAIGNLQPRQVQDFWRLRVVPNNAVLAVSGPLSWEACRETVQTVLGGMLPRQVPPEPTLERPQTERATVVYEPWNGSAAVVLAAAACPGPGSDAFPPVAVLNAVLAGGEGSRLFRALRDAHGWVYSVSQELMPSNICGLVAVRASCAPERASQVLRTMQAEFSRLGSESPSDAEIERAKAYLTSSYVLGHQRNAEVAHFLGLFEVLVPRRPGTDLPKLLAGVTTAQVAQAATSLLSRVVWVQVGGEQPG